MHAIIVQDVVVSTTKFPCRGGHIGYQFDNFNPLGFLMMNRAGIRDSGAHAEEGFQRYSNAKLEEMRAKGQTRETWRRG